MNISTYTLHCHALLCQLYRHSLMMHGPYEHIQLCTGQRPLLPLPRIHVVTILSPWLHLDCSPTHPVQLQSVLTPFWIFSWSGKSSKLSGAGCTHCLPKVNSTGQTVGQAPIYNSEQIWHFSLLSRQRALAASSSFFFNLGVNDHYQLTYEACSEMGWCAFPPPLGVSPILLPSSQDSRHDSPGPANADLVASKIPKIIPTGLNTVYIQQINPVTRAAWLIIKTLRYHS